MAWTVLHLGCGMQGKASLADILKNKNVGKVIVCDLSDETITLNKKYKDERITFTQMNVMDEAGILKLMHEADIVIEFMPGVFSLYIAKLAVKAGTNLVTSMYLFNPGEQDPKKREAQKKEIETLNREAKEKGITLIEEFGMDPGMDLVLGARALKDVDKVKVFYSYGAGFPEHSASHNPLRYKFTWSILGAMRSYLRPAVVLEDGMKKAIKAEEMFDPENMHTLKLGELESELECFANGNSIPYSEIFGISGTVCNMGRYICRWPGTGAFWRVMAKSGFLDSEKIEVDGVQIAPDAFCAALLGGQKQFHYEAGERDIALIRSDVRGYKKGKPVRVVYQIIDKRDPVTGFTAMQRTVGYTASIGAQMILDGRITKRGIVNPVEVPFESYMKELQKRGIAFTFYMEPWDENERP